MRSLWKGPLLGDPTVVGRTRGTPWADQIEEFVYLYTGRFWVRHRVRPYFGGRPWGLFVRHRPVGRPIRLKFARLRVKRRRR